MHKINLKQHSKLTSVHAASGLIKLGNNFYMIADDQLSLAVFTLDTTDSIQFAKLVEGVLPEDHRERKKIKPDWESLVCLRSLNNMDEILVLPSGSKPNRTVGVLAKINASDLQSVKKIDFSVLYAHLEKTFPDLNIEGAVVAGSVLKIFQRGNGSSRQNAIIDLDLKGLIADLESTGIISADHLLKTTHYDLGTLESVALSFTDACFCNDQLFFIAAAEASDSTYDDGKYIGAVLGCINQSGEIIFQKELLCEQKPEGLWVEVNADSNTESYFIYVVTDADDSEIKSSLFVGEFKF